MSQNYIHGYSIEEQHRLINQAEVLAANIHAGLDLSDSRSLLELGCGAGAELDYLRSHCQPSSNPDRDMTICATSKTDRMNRHAHSPSPRPSPKDGRIPRTCEAYIDDTTL